MLKLLQGEQSTLLLCFWLAGGSSPQIYLLRRAGRPLVSQTVPLRPGNVRGETRLASSRLSHPSARKTSWWWLLSPALPHKRKQLKWEQQHYLGTTEQCWSLFSPCLPSNSTHFHFCILFEAEVKQGPFPMAYGACPTLWSIWTFAVCIPTNAVACKCQFHGYTLETASASQILLNLFYSCREKATDRLQSPAFTGTMGNRKAFHVKVLNQRRYHIATKKLQKYSRLEFCHCCQGSSLSQWNSSECQWHLSSFRG